MGGLPAAQQVRTRDVVERLPRRPGDDVSRRQGHDHGQATGKAADVSRRW
jgi:hypothetical protein